MRKISIAIAFLSFGLMSLNAGLLNNSLSLGIQSLEAAAPNVKCSHNHGKIVCKKAVKHAPNRHQKRMMRRGLPVVQTRAKQCKWTCTKERGIWICRGSGPECEGAPTPWDAR